MTYVVSTTTTNLVVSMLAIFILVLLSSPTGVLAIPPAVLTAQIVTIPAGKTPRLNDQFRIEYTTEPYNQAQTNIEVRFQWKVIFQNPANGVQLLLPTPTDRRFFLVEQGYSKGDRLQGDVIITDTFDQTVRNRTTAIITFQNLPPFVNAQPTVVPQEPSTSDIINCSLPLSAVEDFDDPLGPFNFSYTWNINSQNRFEFTKAALPASVTQTGDTVRCVVTVSDGFDNSIPSSSSTITVVSAQPLLTTVTVSPTTGGTETERTCVPGQVLNPDNVNIQLSFRYDWRKIAIPGLTLAEVQQASYETQLEGTSISQGDAVDKLDVALTRKGEIWYCTITVIDALQGTPIGRPRPSPRFIIDNTPPVVRQVQLVPGTPTRASNITCRAGQISDIDFIEANVPLYLQRNITLSYLWYINDNLVTRGSFINPATNLTEPRPYDSIALQPASFKKNDQVQCRISASDGITSSGYVASGRVLVTNSAPIITGVIVTRDETRVYCQNDTIIDADGDAILQSQNRFQWFVNGVEQTNAVTNSIRIVGETDTIQCVMTVFDVELLASTPKASFPFSADAPAITSWSVGSTRNDDTIYSNGDFFTIMFGTETDMAGYAIGQRLNKGQVDTLFTPSTALGAEYHGEWLSTSTFRLTVDDTRNSTGVVKASTFKISTNQAGQLRNAEKTSLPSSSQSGSLQAGSFGDAPSIYSWGGDGRGDGDSVSAAQPRDVSAMPSSSPASTPMIYVAASRSSSLSVDGNGNLWGLGSNLYGQFGITMRAQPYTSLVLIDSLPFSSQERIIGVAVAPRHSLVISSQGIVYAAGENRFGQLGFPPTAISDYDIWQEVRNLATGSGGGRAVDVGGHRRYSCAVMDQGDVWCWGTHFGSRYDANGETTFGASRVQNTGPRLVTVEPILDASGEVIGQRQVVRGGIQAKQISCGERHVIILTHSNDVYTWGSNRLGQTGHPIALRVVETPLQLKHFFVRQRVATDRLGVPVSIAHRNTTSTLVYASTLSVTVEDVPVVTTATGTDGSQVTTIKTETKLSYDINAAVAPDYNTMALASRTFQNVAAGDYHSLIVSRNGVVYCFGKNADGQCGMGGSEFRVEQPQRIDVLLLYTIKETSAGDTHSMFLDTNGRVFVAGFNEYGLMGIGRTYSLYPTLFASNQTLTSAVVVGDAQDSQGRYALNQASGARRLFATTSAGEFDTVYVTRIATGENIAMAATRSSTTACFDDCRRRGICEGNDQCACGLTWSGRTCETAVCYAGCNNRGTCVIDQQRNLAVCQCIEGFRGEACQFLDCTRNGLCSAHGTCATVKSQISGQVTDVTCDCDLGFASNVTSSGQRTHGQKLCDRCAKGWTNAPLCNVIDCGQFRNCTGHGVCGVMQTISLTQRIVPQLQCKCNEGWSGDECQNPTCDGGGITAAGEIRPVCFGHGDCISIQGVPTCQCRGAWGGRVCNETRCLGQPEECGGFSRGTCLQATATCQCKQFWSGGDCSVPSCAHLTECSGHGSCRGDRSQPYCLCQDSWTGADCSSESGGIDTIVIVLIFTTISVIVVVVGILLFNWYRNKVQDTRRPANAIGAKPGGRSMPGFVDRIDPSGPVNTMGTGGSGGFGGAAGVGYTAAGYNRDNAALPGTMGSPPRPYASHQMSSTTGIDNSRMLHASGGGGMNGAPVLYTAGSSSGSSSSSGGGGGGGGASLPPIYGGTQMRQGTPATSMESQSLLTQQQQQQRQNPPTGYFPR